MENNTKKSNYCCRICGKQFKSEKLFNKNRQKCEEKYKNKIENIDYVECKICGFRSKQLFTHLKKHNIDVKKYKKKYGLTVCKNSSQFHSEMGIKYGNWIQGAKESGIDLTEYCQNMSNSVSVAIMSNKKERKRRSKLMTKLNEKNWNNDEYRQQMSDIAKKTSARQDIIEQRSNNLKKWRNENREEFFEKCLKKMHATWSSKPELMLLEFLLKLPNFNFRRNQFIKSNIFNWPSHIKQIDMLDQNKNIYVEFDGIFHFKAIHGEETLKIVKNRDLLLEKYILLNNYTLIRISHDQFFYKQGGFFGKNCLNITLNILNSFQKGIFKIGNSYG